jgi:hypothetical protein
MRRALTLHPDSKCDAVTGINVEVERRNSGVTLRYAMMGSMNNVRMAPLAAATRADGLWQHTCFEAFIRSPKGAAYFEFNVAPSTQWAVYRFAGYRDGMARAVLARGPHLDVRSNTESFTLQIDFELRDPSELSHDGPWNVGLSAVIEETNGRMSYWALAHPRGKPDFHHPDCFALELPPASAI